MGHLQYYSGCCSYSFEQSATTAVSDVDLEFRDMYYQQFTIAQQTDWVDMHGISAGHDYRSSCGDLGDPVDIAVDICVIGGPRLGL